MRLLKFSGRELSVLRAIDFCTGTDGGEILLRTRIDTQEALDILNSFLEIGYIETVPAQHTPVEFYDFSTTMFEMNPAFVHELKKALVR